MANQIQLEIIKLGFEAWNRWRLKNSDIKVNLTKADLNRADLSRADLSKADLNGATLFQANLSGANLSEADLSEADLSGANLSGANLSRADLSGANLSGADLRANLSEANLRNAYLMRANLSRADLRGADLSNSIINSTSFGDVELRSCLGLEKIEHQGPSHISTSTIDKSKGQLPVEFLRGCGLSDWEIESAKLYNPELSNQEISELQYKIYDLRATRSIQVSPLFISYSHADRSFVDKLGEKLTEMGIRYWRDIHDMKSGRMEKQVDRALRLNPTVLVVLSENSVQSDWVEHEVETARGLEKELNRDCLCPVALDDSWKSSH